MNKLFKFTIILMILFAVAVGYYLYIWISFEPEDPLGGDKEELAFEYIKDLALQSIYRYHY